METDFIIFPEAKWKYHPETMVDGDENHEYHEGTASSAIKKMGIFVSKG